MSSYLQQAGLNDTHFLYAAMRFSENAYEERGRHPFETNKGFGYKSIEVSAASIAFVQSL